MRKFFRYLIKKYSNFFNKIGNKLIYKDQININLDLCNLSQKRVLISYITLTGVDLKKIRHASFLHLNQIIKYFILRGYCIDICRLDDIAAYDRLKDNKYDVILGFGSVYKKFCKYHNIPSRVCFIMENNPKVVQDKYNERIKYFKERHPNINTNLGFERMGYFDTETFNMSNYAIIMQSEHNLESFKPFFNKYFKINSNAIFNPFYKFDEKILKDKIELSRKNILWFGSLGLIHKGLDILIDSMDNFPNLNLICYGIDKREYKLYNKLKKKNTINAGIINVLSREFISDVIYQNNFVFLPSCSEGMSTAIATCMAHGLIPIITQDCGFDETNCIVQLSDFSIDTITAVIKEINEWSNEKILAKRKECYLYARNYFSLDRFSTDFTYIMDSLLQQ